VSGSREALLDGVRAALGRRRGQARPACPPSLLAPRNLTVSERVALFVQRFEKLNGKAICAGSRAEAKRAVEGLIQGRSAVASNAPFLIDCGIQTIAGIRSGITDKDELRAACATADFGVTGATYALADTGTFVMMSSPEEGRLISLLPPAHIGVISASSILSGLDDLLTAVPKPSDATSAMVLITGPSRTADIEQILVRGVHGPGEIYAVIVDEESQ